MYFYFDYIYYRLAKYYFDSDGKTGVKAICSIVLVQVVVLLDIYATLTRLVWHYKPPVHSVIKPWIICIVLVVLLTVMNYYRHRDRYDAYDEKWKNEPQKTMVTKGSIMVFSMIVPVIVIYFLAKIHI